MKYSTPALRAGALYSVLCLSVCPAVCQSAPFLSEGAPASQTTPKIQRIQNGVELTTGDLNVRVQLYSEGTVRILKWPAGGTSAKASLCVIQKDVPDLSVGFEESADAVALSSAKMKLQLSKRDGAIRYLSSDRRPILEEQGRAIFKPAEVAQEKSAFSVQQNFKLT